MSNFHPIILLTDFGTKDTYVASMKGVILSLFPQATLVDLSHEVEPQNVTQAAFLLEWTYSYCPTGSVFISVVDPGVGSKRQILAAKTPRGIFLAPDNGLLTRILNKEKKCELRSVTNRNFFLKKVSFTFHGRDCFSPTGARLAKNPSLFSKLGPRTGDFVKLPLQNPRKEKGKIASKILFFDHFGNAFINLHRSFLGKPGRESCVVVKGKKIGPIRRSYYEVKKGKVVAVFNSMDLLEIGINQGSAKEALKLKTGDAVEVIEP